MKFKKTICAMMCVPFIMMTACTGAQTSSDTSTTDTTKSTDTAETEVWDRVEKAYEYVLPLIMTHLTRTTATNVEEPDSSSHAPVNQLIHSQGLANATTKDVVTPNVDTVYTQAWIDLSDEPMVLTLPNTDRFFNAQILDAWTNTVVSLTEEGSYAFVKSDWSGTLPEGVTKVEVPTNDLWLITRVLLNGEDDMDNVKAIQSGMSLVPLSAFEDKENYVAPKGEVDDDDSFVPVEKLKTMSIEEYFDTANELMEKNPPAEADEEFLSTIKDLNIGAGLDFESSDLPGDVETNYENLLTSLRSELKTNSTQYINKLGDWDYYAEPIGDFGTAYTYRALIALVGLGANPTSVAIYPRTDVDSDGNELSGENTYILHFDSLPQVKEDGFWSVTAYGSDDFLIDNPIDRYSINDRMDFELNDDGSLDIVVSATEPENAKNWLPVSDDTFHLHLRIYYPSEETFTTWTAPIITINK